MLSDEIGKKLETIIDRVPGGINVRPLIDRQFRLRLRLRLRAYCGDVPASVELPRLSKLGFGGSASRRDITILEDAIVCERAVRQIADVHCSCYAVRCESLPKNAKTVTLVSTCTEWRRLRKSSGDGLFRHAGTTLGLQY